MKLLRVALLMSGITAILFAAGCGGGQAGPTPIAAGEEVTPTEAPVPTSISVPTAASNPTSSPSSTLPPISSALRKVSPELITCVQTALGSEQYNALLSGDLDVTPQQVSIVIPCLMQYPQDTKAIMDLFGLDMGTIMGAANPTPSAQTPPSTPVPTNTPPLVPTATTAPMSTPTPTSVPTATPIPVPTPTPYPTATPTPSPPSTPAPPTKFEGGFVMLLGGSFQIAGEISFKIGQYVAEETVTVNMGAGELLLADLYATSTNSEVPYTAQTGSSAFGGNPPNVIAGRAYIDGNYAPDGTVVTAWIGGEETVEARTTVINNPVAVEPTELVSLLETFIPAPSPLPTPCPKYLDCGQQYYSGRLSDDIDVIWNNAPDGWLFYSTDPAWRLANNLSSEVVCVSQMCSAGPYIKAKTGFTFDEQANRLKNFTLVEGWNFNSLVWSVGN